MDADDKDSEEEITFESDNNSPPDKAPKLTTRPTPTVKIETAWKTITRHNPRPRKNAPIILDDTDDDEEDEDDDSYDLKYDPDGRQRDVRNIEMAFRAVNPTEIQQLTDDQTLELDDIKKQLDATMFEAEEAEADPDEDNQDQMQDPLVYATKEPNGSNTNQPDVSPTHLQVAEDEPEDFTPPPIDPDRSLRFGVRITFPAAKHDEQLKTLCTVFADLLKDVQGAIGKNVGIGTWDEQKASQQSPIARPADMPRGNGGSKDKEFLQTFFGAWPRIKTDKAYVNYHKIRFITAKPDTLNFPLGELGENLSDGLEAKCRNGDKDPKVQLSRSPLSCQATKAVVVGWLHGSVKSINEHTFIPAVRKQLNIPNYVAIGVVWKTLRTIQKTPHKWDPDDKPPQALTVEIDEDYYPIYEPKMAALWKKRSKKRVCGINLRLVPCFTSPSMDVVDSDTATDMLNLIDKQQHLVNHHQARLPVTKFISQLDLPIKDKYNEEWTLRRYLMSKSPHGFPSDRLFITTDRNWDGNGYILVTIKTYYDEALRALNNMVPECVWMFGKEAAKKWFTTTGLHAFQNIRWDPDKGKTHSTDRALSALVDEDFLGMGKEWQTKNRVSRDTAAATAAAFIPASIFNPDQTQVTAKDIIAERQKNNIRSDDSVKTFGDRVFHREHDGDTVATKLFPGDDATALEDETALPQGDAAQNPSSRQLRFDLTGMEIQDREADVRDDETVTMSTADHTTGSTRVKLKQISKQNDRLATENENQAKELETQTQENEDLRAQLAALAEQMAQMRQTTIPPTRKKVTLVTPRDRRTTPGQPPLANTLNGGVGEGT